MSRPPRQQLLPFARRSRRLDRIFRGIIAALTISVIVALIAGTNRGRLASARVSTSVRAWAFSLVGGELNRENFETLRRLRRQRGIELVRGFLGNAMRERGPLMERFLNLAAMSPDSAVIRWGNFHWTLVLSSKVFEPDDTGRSYKMRPGVRSVWLIGLTLHNALSMFLVPNDPAILDAGQAAGGRLVPESVQTTNSWGCRGPEPDLSAPLRVLVLGDSMMQGLLVGDNDTPSEYLRRDLSRALGCRVSVLNTGVLGYSLEQYYYTLVEFFDRLHPRYVIIGICDNDLGDLDNPDDQAEVAYWVEQISQFCRTRQVDHLFVPAPREEEILGLRDASRYPGVITHVLKRGGMNYLDPIPAFVNAELRLINQSIQNGTRSSSSPLYNGHLGDHHFSAKGCAVWGSIVSERLSLIEKYRNLNLSDTRQASLSHQ